MVEQRPNQQRMERARASREAFVAAIPVDLREAEDLLPKVVAGLNASARSKLQKIYALADELSKVRAPFVACKDGCVSCCHMNVSLTAAEADRLGKAIGRRPTAVSRTLKRPVDRFAGKPCPFLDAGQRCSIYVHRPLACRKHSSFFEDDAACRPGVMNDLQVPMLSFGGLDAALFIASDDKGDPVLGDIRDYFPRPDAAQP
jgi:Fe-S-cluster containining protein